MNSAQKQWDKKIRSRDHKSSVARLAALGRKLAVHTDDDDSIKLSDKLLNLSTVLHNRSEFFTQLRNETIETLSAPMSQAVYNILLKLEPRLLSTIMAHVSLKVLGGPTQAVHCCLLLAQISADEKRLSLGLVKDSVKAVDSQIAMVLNFADNVILEKTDREYVEIMAKVKEFFPTLAVCAQNFEPAEFDPCKIVEDTGLCHQAWLDLSAIFIFAALVDVKQESGIQGLARKQCRALLCNQELISTRLQALMRVGGRSGHNHAKAGMDKLLEFWPKGTMSVEDLATQAYKAAMAVGTNLQSALASERELGVSPTKHDLWSLSWDAVVDFSEDPLITDLRTFGSLLAEMKASDHDPKQYEDMVKIREDLFVTTSACYQRVSNQEGGWHKLFRELVHGVEAADGVAVFERHAEKLSWLSALHDVFQAAYCNDMDIAPVSARYSGKWVEIFSAVANVRIQVLKNEISDCVELTEWGKIAKLVHSVRSDTKASMSSGRCGSSDFFSAMQQLQSLAASMDFDVPVTHFVQDVVSSEKLNRVTQQFQGLAEEYAGILPMAVQTLMQSCKVYSEVKASYTFLGGMSTIGTVEGAQLLTKAFNVHPAIACKMEYKSWLDDIQKDWAQSVKAFAAKVTDLRDALNYLKTFEGLGQAVTKWQFTGKLGHLNGGKPATKEEIKIGHDMEQMVVSMPTHLRLLTAVEPMLKDLPEAEARLLQGAVDKRREYESTVKQVTLTLASSVVLQAVLASTTPDELHKRASTAQTYVQNKLKLSIDQLPYGLDSKVKEAVQGQATPEKGAGKEAASSAALVCIAAASPTKRAATEISSGTKASAVGRKRACTVLGSSS